MFRLSRISVFVFCCIATTLLAQSSFGQMMQYRPEISDLSGNPVSAIAPGDEFLLNMYVQDLTPEGRGVFSAYVDVTYDANLFTATGPFTFGQSYPSAQRGDLTVPGLIDEAGAVCGIAFLGPDERLLWSLTMTSTDEQGTGVFATDPADLLPQHETVLHGGSVPVGPSDMALLTTSLTVVPEPNSYWILLTGISVICLRFRRRR